jgi:steroid delta-isomerase-like uncharacterized protein
MSDPKTQVLQRWFEEVWNQAREEAIDELAAPDVVAHGLFDAEGKEISDREKFKLFYRQFRTAFPDVRVEVHDHIVDGDKRAVRCTVYATHKGEGIGVAPCHKPVQFSGMVIARIEDGKIKEVWDTWDFLGLYQQIGALPDSFTK